jgi:ribosomal protein S12 methylthiotransferase accessory factor
VDVGGDGSAPSPYTLFLASLATCAGFYVVNFCRKRNILTEGIRMVQRAERDPATGLATNVTLDIQLPADFPEKYTSALVRAAEQCLVKKQLDHPPVFEIKTSIGEAALG